MHNRVEAEVIHVNDSSTGSRGAGRNGARRATTATLGRRKSSPIFLTPTSALHYKHDQHSN